MKTRPPITILALTLGIWMASASAGAAHSVLERSLPPANASLDSPSREVRLTFTESIDPSFSSMNVLDAQGKAASGRPFISGSRRELAAPLESTAQGIYTVKWRVLSAVDGHTTSGFFVFAIGQPAPSGLGTPMGEAPGIGLITARWIGFLASLLLVGSAVFPLAVLRPGLRGIDPRDASAARAELTDRLYGLQAGAGILLLFSVAIEFVLTATTLFDASFFAVVARGLLWPLLMGTKGGWSVLIRIPLAALLLVPPTRRGQIVQSIGLIFFIGITGLAVLFKGPAALANPSHVAHLTVLVGVTSVYGLVQSVRRPPDVHWMPWLAAAGIFAGMTLTAHASGSGGVAIVADWTHLAAAGVWIGGLASLFVILWTTEPPDRARLARMLVPPFSTLAGLSLGVLIVTGAYSAWLQVPALRALLVTAYGQALLVKLLLVLPLAILGAFSHFVVRPRLQSRAGSASTRMQHRFRVGVGLEIALAATVLGATAILTQLPPARVSLPAAAIAAPSPLVLAGAAEDVRVRLTITSARLAWNRFEASVTDRSGRPLDADTRVLLRFTKLDEDLSPSTVLLTGQGPGRYAGEGGELSLPGWWELEVIARRRGLLDATARFPLRLGQLPEAPDPAARRLLDQARATLTAVQTWRERVELTDGVGNFVVTDYDLVRPNRLRYRTSSGTDAIIIGKTRYLRTGAGDWAQDTLAEPLVVEGPFLQYMAGARSVGRGIQAPCDSERCQVVAWSTDPTTAFAAWIGLQTHQIHRLLMVAPSHYMVVRIQDANAGFQINPPQP